MPDDTYSLMSDADFERLELAESLLEGAVASIQACTTAPHVQHIALRADAARADLHAALTVDAFKDMDLEDEMNRTLDDPAD